MQITFIGTGSGKTSLARYHSSIVIEFEKHLLLMDAGDGVSRALLKHQINLMSLDSVLISHFHPDHVGGFSSLINQMHILKREKPLTVYVHKNLNEALYSLLNTSLIFPEKLNFDLSVKLFDTNEEKALTGNLTFTSKQNRHVTNKHKISYIPEDNFISSSFKIQTDDLKIIYTSDVGSPEDLYLFSDKNTDLLITETTHILTDDILKAINKLTPGLTYLTHIDEKDEAVLADFASSNASSKIVMAYDGLKITL